MGTLRILLALSVLFSHLNAWEGGRLLVGGIFAVKLFFVISGFYMSMILHERYCGPGSTRVFYANRALRLLPVYYFVLLAPILLTVAGRMLKHADTTFGALSIWREHSAHLQPSMKWLLVLTNVTVLGQEWTWFRPNDGDLRQWLYTGLPGNEKALPGFWFLLNPPSWTLAVELGFYALAPWLVRRPWPVFAGILLACGAFRLSAPHWAGQNSAFWLYYSLPGALFDFLLGAAAYRTGSWWKRVLTTVQMRRAGLVCLAVFTLLLFAFPLLDKNRVGIGSSALSILLAGSLPFIFTATSTWRLDRWIGELSYPLYMVHWNSLMIYSVVKQALGVVISNMFLESILSVLFCVLIAVILHYLVESPVERLRRRLTPINPPRTAT